MHTIVSMAFEAPTSKIYYRDLLDNTLHLPENKHRVVCVDISTGSKITHRVNARLADLDLRLRTILALTDILSVSL